MAVSTMNGSASVMHVARMSLYLRVESTSGPAIAAPHRTAVSTPGTSATAPAATARLLWERFRRTLHPGR